MCFFAFQRVVIILNILIFYNKYYILVICAISYWLVGYGLAYGGGGCLYYGKEFFAGVGMPSSQNGVWFFQYVFAATAATIISGAVAERCNFIAYIFYSVIVSGKSKCLQYANGL